MSLRILLVLGLSLLAMLPNVSGQNFQIDINQFDSWIFQGLQNSQNARQALESQVEREIVRLEQSVPLAESQKEKIRLAGQGDLKRFYNDVERARRKFRALEGEQDQKHLNEAYQLAMPLQQRINLGLFSKESLVKKVSRSILDGEQAQAVRKREEQQRKRQTEAKIHFFVAKLSRQIALTASQREQLVGLLSEKVKLVDPSTRYAQYAIAYCLSEVSSKQLAEILDQAQRKAIESTLQQGKQMKRTLVQQGVLDED